MSRLARALGLDQSQHAKGRYRLAAYAIGTNIFSKLSAFVVLIFSTRVVLTHLGPERFGIWSTITSIAVLLSFFDLGISNALVSRIASLQVDPRQNEASKLVTGALLSLGLLGVAVAALLYSLASVIPMEFWFRGALPPALEEGRRAASVFGLLFGISLVAQGAFKVYAGLQLGWIGNLCAGVGWCVSAGLVYVGPRLNGSMSYYLVATYGIQQMVGALMLVGLARRGLLSRDGCRIQNILHEGHGELFRQGRLFFVMQISVAVVWGSNQIILSTIAGPTSAAEFSIVQRLFMCIQVGLSILNAPLWAMYADAYARGEAKFIRGLLWRSISVSGGLAIAGCIALVAAHGPLLHYFFPSKLAVTYTVTSLMAMWTILEACGNAYAMYLNGVGAIRPQVITGVVFVLAGLPLKIVAAQRWGVPGLLAAMVVSYLLFTVAPLLTVLRKECFAPLAALRSDGHLRL